MKSVPVTRLSNDDLLCELKQNVAHGCTHTARQVALIAEVDRRRLYAPAGFPSMFTFCVGELHLPEDAAYKRIQVARVARRHPAVLTALAEGRVHLTGLNLMSAHFKVLPPEVVNELLEAATHRSKKDIELLLAQRFPKADLQAEVRAIPSAGVQSPALKSEPANERPEQPQPVANTESELGRPVIPAIRPAEYTRVAPLAPQRYGVQFTLDEVGHDLLRQVQDLLGHEVPRSDLAEVFVRALKAYATLLAKQKHAATEHPRVPRPQKPGSRHISGHVKRVVRKRDKGQCTYVNDAGHRCEARSDLEYDHAIEFARGGEATASNIRLRCRAHNQYGAERTYGAAFMQHKREKRADARGASVTAT
jgi:5-methylcytosine-specific restriction endonuclease McrA